MFDLTVVNIVGKYFGKDGFKMFIYLVFKVFLILCVVRFLLWKFLKKKSKILLMNNILEFNNYFKCYNFNVFKIKFLKFYFRLVENYNFLLFI